MTLGLVIAPPATGGRIAARHARGLAGGWGRTIGMRDGTNIQNGLIADVQVGAYDRRVN